jgi:flavin-dependent dehydrogenase
MAESMTCDCLVIGGGPAGSTVAALLAAAGRRTVLVEQDRWLGRRVGESLLPAGCETLARLGVQSEIQAANLLPKPGIRFLDHEGACRYSLQFPAPEQAWQAPRPQFDQLLFENAARQGARCLRETTVLELLFDGPRACGVRVQPPDSGPRDICASIIVDAGGRLSPLAAKFTLHAPAADTLSAAIWGYYRGALREPGRDEGTTLLFRARHRRAWFWYVPLPENLVNVGVVGEAVPLAADRSQIAAVFEEELVNCPAVAQRLIDAELTSPLRAVRNLCYQSRQAAGPGWLLVGDALAGVDPLLCAGVTLALKSGEWAADAILATPAGHLTAACLADPWIAEHRAATQRLWRLGKVLHSPHFEISSFLTRYPEREAGLSRLLMAEVFSAENDAVLADLERSLQPANSLTSAAS